MCSLIKSNLIIIKYSAFISKKSNYNILKSQESIYVVDHNILLAKLECICLRGDTYLKVISKI